MKTVTEFSGTVLREAARIRKLHPRPTPPRPEPKPPTEAAPAPSMQEAACAVLELDTNPEPTGTTIGKAEPDDTPARRRRK